MPDDAQRFLAKKLMQHRHLVSCSACMAASSYLDLKRARLCFAPAGQHRLTGRGKGWHVREERLGAKQRRGDGSS